MFNNASFTTIKNRLARTLPFLSKNILINKRFNILHFLHINMVGPEQLNNKLKTT